MDKKIQKKKITGIMTDKNITGEENKKLEEFSKLTQIIKLRNDDNDPVKIIIDKKNKNNELNVTEKNDNFQEYIDELKDLTSKIDDETRDFMKKTNTVFIYIKNLFSKITGINEYTKFIITDEHIKNIFNIFNEKENIKHKNMLFYNIDKNPPQIENKKIYFNKRYLIHITSFLLLYKYLETNGNIIISIQYFLSKFINIIYLGSLLFEEVYILGRGTAFFKNFKNDPKYINLLLDIIKNNYNFKVENKKNESELIILTKKYIILDLYFKKKLILNNNKKLYEKYMYINYTKDLLTIGIQNFKKSNYPDILKINNKNDSKKLVFNIFNNEYKILLNLIKKNNCTNCLEIGNKINFLKNIVIDLINTNLTFVSSSKIKSENNNLNKKYNKKYILYYGNTLNIYNQFYKNNYKFDFIFLNDKYTFDFILFYFIYSDKILKKDGLIVINNSHLNSVSYCVKYIEFNLKNYKKIGFYSTFTVFKKINDEEKNNVFFQPF